MAVTTNNSMARETVPMGYREVLYWRITDKRWRTVVMTLVGILSLMPWLFLFGWLGSMMGRMPQSGNFGTLELLLVVPTCWLLVILHELTHALAMSACGAHPRFGILYYGLMAYTTAPGHVFSRSAYVAVALAPLVGLSLLALLGMVALAGTPWVGLLVFCAAVNAAGAIGDLWIVSIIFRYPSNARAVDERDGMRVLLPA
jgi:hypothetical protein